MTLNSELELAKVALRVLPDNGSEEFEKLYKTGNHDLFDSGTAELAQQCVVLNYDLNHPRPLDLPPSLDQHNTLITHYLTKSTASDPWGFLNEKIIALKISDRPDARVGRLLLFSRDFISALFERLFPLEKITMAEQNTILQCLSGLTLKEAATLDGVSYETKKSQLKSVFQKTDIKRQQVLSSFLIAHLTLAVASDYARKSSPQGTDEQFFSYVDQYMGEHVRGSVIQDRSKTRIRLIEIGDPSGTPMVCIHHLGIINFSPDEIKEITRQRIRLICPLRQGAMGSRDQRISFEEHIEHAIAGIDLAVSLIPERQVTVVSLLSGCLYALQYLRRYPEKIQRLILISASCRAAKAKYSLSGFKRTIHNLASKNQTLFNATVAYLVSRVEKPEQLRKVWKESLKECEVDYRLIDTLFDDPKQVQAMQYRFKHSLISIVRDLQIQAESNWQPLTAAPENLPVHFIHGSIDKTIPIKNVQDIVDWRKENHLHVIEGAGNWMFGDFMRAVFSEVRLISDSSSQTLSPR